jgi:molybdate transport system substrate-binding protein
VIGIAARGRRPRTLLALLVVVGVVLAACGTDTSTPSKAPAPQPSPAGGPTSGPASPGKPAALTVYAESALTDALKAAKTAYEAANPGVTLTLTFGASNALRSQLEQGANADVFLSADVDNAAALVDGGLTNGPEMPFAGSMLSLIIPKANPGKILRPADLSKPGVHLVAAGTDDPLSTYSRDLVTALSKIKGYPAGYAAGVEKNITSREANVRAVLAKIQLGSGDAAFVYQPDAQSAGESIHSLVLPPELNLPATFAGVVLRNTANEDAAGAFLGWLAGPDGQAILAKYGFSPPPQ